MKKKLLMTVMTLCLCFVCVFSFAACSKNETVTMTAPEVWEFKVGDSLADTTSTITFDYTNEDGVAVTGETLADAIENGLTATVLNTNTATEGDTTRSMTITYRGWSAIVQYKVAGAAA